MATEILSDLYDAVVDAHSAATSAKAFYVRAGMVQMAMNNADANADNVFVVAADNLRVPKATGTAWTVGERVYYDAGNSNFTTVRAGNAFAGYVREDAESDATEGKITLNKELPDVASPAGAAFTVGDEDTNVINVAVQLKDALAQDLANAVALPFYLSDDAAGATPSGTAPTGGLAVGTPGPTLVLALLAALSTFSR